MHLQATPDFSAFQFTSEGLSGNITRQVRLIGQKDGKIYTLDLRDLPAGKNAVPKNVLPERVADIGDTNNVLATLVQIIEIYTERYPRRAIRLMGNTEEKAQLYRAAVERHLDILHPLFLISLEEHSHAPLTDQSINNIALLLKRKPVPYFTIHTIHTTWSGHSRLFKRKVMIDLNKGVRVGIALPEV